MKTLFKKYWQSGLMAIAVLFIAPFAFASILTVPQGGTGVNIVASGNLLYGTGTNVLANDANHTIDPSTGYVNLSATVGTDQTADFQINNNLLGLGLLNGYANTYQDSNFPGIFGINLASDSFNVTSQHGLFTINGIVDPTGNVSAGMQGVYIPGIDQSNVQLTSADSAGDSTQIKLTSNPSTQKITFQFPAGDYKFPSSVPNMGDVLTAADGSGDLAWQPPTGGGTPGGSDTDVQYNSSGAFAGDSNFTWDPSTQEFNVGGVGGVAGQYTAFGVNLASGNNDIIANLAPSASFQISEKGDSSNVLSYFTSGGVDQNSIVLGDPYNAGHGTNVNISDSASQILLQASNSTVIQGASNSDTTAVFSPGTNPTDVIGDYTGIGNGTVFDLDDMGQTISMSDHNGLIIKDNALSGGNAWFNVNPGTSLVQFGAIQGQGNGTVFDVNDNAQNIYAASNTFYLENPANGTQNYFQGNWNSGNPIVEFGSAGGSGHDTNFSLNDSTQDVLFNAGHAGLAGNFSVDDAVGNAYLDIDQATETAFFGDASGGWVNGAGVKVDGSAGTVTIGDIIGNNTNFTVNKTSDMLTFGQSAYQSLSVDTDPSIGTFEFGDVGNNVNGTTFLLNDQAQTYTLSKLGGGGNQMVTTNNSGVLGTSPLPQSVSTSGDLLAQSGAVATVATVTSPNDGNKHTYSLGGYLNVTAVTLDVIQEQVTYTDENGTSQTETFFPPGLTSANIGSVGNFPMGTMNIRVNPNTSITIKTVLTTGTGSIGYDVGGTIQLLK